MSKISENKKKNLSLNAYGYIYLVDIYSFYIFTNIAVKESKCI